MSRLRGLFCALILVTSALAQGPGAKLKMVVIVTRHGVRPPLDQSPKSPYAQDPWPSLNEWGARCAGDLTKTGFKLATLMGGYYSQHYIHERLLPEGCPSEQVYIWADNEERTEETAAALAKGLAHGLVGCSVKVNSLPYTVPDENCKSTNKTDYFFHPLADATLKGKVDSKKMQEIADGITLSLPRLRSLYAPELSGLQKVVICCDADKCPPTQPSCTLPRLPDTATVTDSKLQWQFPFSVGSTDTENLLLEYANGMPCSAVGWGRASFDYTDKDCNPPSGPHFRRMQRLHTVYFYRAQQAPYIARTQGSNLANQILEKLQQGAAGFGPPLVIFAGHDTNLANLAGLLNLSWTLSDLPANDTPPAGALVFELYQDRASKFSVKLRYVHANMAQMRQQSELSLANPPELSDVKIRDCANPCSFLKFQSIMTGAIDKKFTTKHPDGDDGD
jgi:4-phytase/acid phosphatase